MNGIIAPWPTMWSTSRKPKRSATSPTCWRACARAEVVIERDARAVAVVRPAGDEFRPRLLSESIALAKKHAEELGYVPTLDPDFAADLEEIIKSRKPREISSWE